MSKLRREYYERNKERILANNKKWRENHREEWAAYMRIYRREHPKYREKMAVWNRGYRARKRILRKREKFESLADELLEAS